MTPSPNSSNNEPIEHVLISEIMYHPLIDANEFIELYNPTASPVSLYDAATSTGWRLDGAVEYSFASGVTIGADEYLLIVDFDPCNSTLLSDFEADYNDVTVQIFGPYSGQLNNAGERLALEKPLEADAPGADPNWVIVDEAIYFDQFPWPPDADGSGKSLQRMNMDLSGNDPDAWLAAEPSLGSYLTFSADFEGDGDVDFFDFAMFAPAWMSQPGQPAWDEKYNIAEPPDTIIDMQDLMEFTEQWLGSN